jgi:hypothetical protein
MTPLLSPDEIPPESITFWVIFDHPRDHPDGFVLRPQFCVMNAIENPGRYGTVTEHFGRALTIASKRAWLCKTLAEARALVPPGCVRFADPNPVIAESWMQ